VGIRRVGDLLYEPSHRGPILSRSHDRGQRVHGITAIESSSVEEKVSVLPASCDSLRVILHIYRRHSGPLLYSRLVLPNIVAIMRQFSEQLIDENAIQAEQRSKTDLREGP